MMVHIGRGYYNTNHIILNLNKLGQEIVILDAAFEHGSMMVMEYKIYYSTSTNANPKLGLAHTIVRTHWSPSILILRNPMG